MSADTKRAVCREVTLKRVTEARGFLLVGELADQLPFPVARFFVVGDVPSGEVRGRHAHRVGEQLLVAVVDAWCGDDHERHLLREGGTALHVPAGTFACQSRFSPGSLLLVLCSHRYDPSDYIEAEEFFAATPDPAVLTRAGVPSDD